MPRCALAALVTGWEVQARARFPRRLQELRGHAAAVQAGGHLEDYVRAGGALCSAPRSEPVENELTYTIDNKK